MASKPTKTGKTRIIEQVPDEMDRKYAARKSKRTNDIAGWKKTIRLTGKMESYDSPFHIISAQISELGITFASKSVDGKSNEIPAVQQLIAELDIQGCMIVADALNFQKETAEAVVKGKGDYLFHSKIGETTHVAEQGRKFCVKKGNRADKERGITEEREWSDTGHLNQA